MVVWKFTRQRIGCRVYHPGLNTRHRVITVVFYSRLSLDGITNLDSIVCFYKSPNIFGRQGVEKMHNPWLTKGCNFPSPFPLSSMLDTIARYPKLAFT
jgi:hypothetical protein